MISGNMSPVWLPKDIKGLFHPDHLVYNLRISSVQFCLHMTQKIDCDAMCDGGRSASGAKYVNEASRKEER